MSSPKKLNTAFRSCKYHCGQTVWAERPVVCPQCKAILAKIASDNRQQRRREYAPRIRLGVAYTRGLAMIRRGHGHGDY